MTRTTSLLTVTALLLSTAASAQRLRSPWDGAPVASTDAPYTCPTPPAFSKTLNADGYYTDKQYSVIDPKKLAAFNEATAGPTHLGQETTRAADQYRTTGSRSAAACVYSLLSAAAAADAWDEDMPQNSGTYLQNWLLSAAGVAYLKVRNSGAGTQQQETAIQEWFRRLAKSEHDYFEAHTARAGSDAWNNHLYWAGLALAAQGVASNDPDALLWGVATYRLGIDAIQPDGSLPAEMARGQMALHYQLYALGALIMIAELGEANGVAMYSQRNGAIHRLVLFDTAALENPDIIAIRTGHTQNIAKTYSGLEIGWAVPYNRRFPNPQLSALIAHSSWTNFWQWGGAPPSIENARVASTTAEIGQRLTQQLAEAFPSPSLSSPFLGAWCVQGDPSAYASIHIEHDALLLAGQSGDPSLAETPMPTMLLAPGWLGVEGNLSPDHSQIDWTNGTYWMRCVASLEKLPDLSGQWIAMGLVAKPASIQMNGKNLALDNGLGATAAGQIDNNGSIDSSWSGNRITGQVTGDGNHINWNNGTYWTRAKVYGKK
ncbi:MAG TPA: alginate lyase family protein [Acidobacteriaceae bacterium]|nr:alginate lyase family protein [Acidobacteriaceae bacterium]